MGHDLLRVHRANDTHTELEKALTPLFFRNGLKPTSVPWVMSQYHRKTLHTISQESLEAR